MKLIVSNVGSITRRRAYQLLNAVKVVDNMHEVSTNVDSSPNHEVFANANGSSNGDPPSAEQKESPFPTNEAQVRQLTKLRNFS